MHFLGLQKPFKKDSVDDYQGVLVSFAHAARHPTVAAEYARKRSAEEAREKGSGEGVKSKDDSEENGVLKTTGDAYSPYTIDGLRAEVFEDVGAGGHDCAYDCKCSSC
jgi:hypothetical protein